MRMIVLAVCMMLAVPVVGCADDDAMKVLLSGVIGWADSQKDDDDEDETMTVKPGLGSEEECDGMDSWTVEKNGKTYKCHESVSCKVTCEESGW